MSSSFIILQWNAQNIISHRNELKHYTYNSNYKPDIICIQESWLNNEINFKLNNYSMVRKDRQLGTGGGVCVYLSKTMNEFVQNVKYNHIEFIIKNKSFNLINIYNPGEKIDLNVVLFLQFKMLLYAELLTQK